MYQSLATEKEGNIFISPYSIQNALQLLTDGAAGNTKKELEVLLGGALPEPESTSITWQQANRLWVQNDLKLSANYLAKVQGSLKASVANVDYRKDPEKARKTINLWISEQTNNKINDLLASGTVRADTVNILTNAVYFKAKWQNPFLVTATQSLPFHLEGGKKVNAMMMKARLSSQYGENDKAQWMGVNYDDYGQTQFFIILPKLPMTLSSFEKSLTAANVEEMFASLNQEKVDLVLPRFKFEFTKEIGQEIQSLGVKQAFTMKADFAPMYEKKPVEPFFVDRVVHKAWIGVDEEGTEAAAATAVSMRAGSAPRPEKIYSFTADRPFLFMITNKTTKGRVVLFMGRVRQP